MVHPVKKIRLGKLQRLWLMALESGVFQQGEGELHNKYADTYCCLGVANHVCKLGENPDNVATLETTFKKLGLRSGSGSPIGSMKKHRLEALTTLNDGTGTATGRRHTFKEIARIIRANPGNYFARSV